MKYLAVLLLTCVLSRSSAFVVFSVGMCPVIPAMEKFDLNKYLGTWYNYENFDAPYQLGFSCVTATYDLIGEGEISVLNQGYRDIMAFGRRVYRNPISILGGARILNPSEESKLYVSFGNQPDFSIYNTPRANYQIVDTDYSNYSMVYSCTQLPYTPIRFEAAWILSRYPANRPEKTDELKNLLKSYDVDIGNFKMVDQQGC